MRGRPKGSSNPHIHILEGEKTERLYRENGDLFPRNLDEVTKGMMIVDWWLHRHGCEMDDLINKLGLNDNKT